MQNANIFSIRYHKVLFGIRQGSIYCTILYYYATINKVLTPRFNIIYVHSRGYGKLRRDADRLKQPEEKKDVIKPEEINTIEMSDDEFEGSNELSKKEKLEKAGRIIVLSLILVCAVIIAMFIKSQFFSAGDSQQFAQSYGAAKTLRINEYMVSNLSTIKDEDWDSPDWIEIYNFGKTTVWLGDVYISDSKSNPEKYKLPDIEIAAGEYILVFASGKDREESANIHASFKLGDDDTEIILYSDNEIIDEIEIVQMPTDISSGYNNKGVIGYFAEPTPYAENTTESSSSPDIAGENSYAQMLLINEYVSNNDYGIKNPMGETSDWIEVYNPGQEPVFLGDFYLSDDPYNYNKYKLPDNDLAANEYIIIYAVGAQYAADNELCAGFAISGDDTVLVLSYSNGKCVDTMEVFDLPPDVSAGKDEEGNTVFFASPTPMQQNNTQASYSYDITGVKQAASPLLLNEWMCNNEFGILDSDGDASDWVEIFNPSDQSIDMSGYGLSDDISEPMKWMFPDNTTIGAQSYLVVYLSGKDKAAGGELHASFLLGQDDGLYLADASAAIIDSAQMEYLPGNVSKGRTEEGYGYFAYPTPGAANTSSYTTELMDGTTFLHSSLYISEVASGRVHPSRSRGQYTYEYIEIYNMTDEEINLQGYSIQEDGGEAFVFPDVTIKADDYEVISVKGYLEKELNYIKGENLSLSSAGERLLLRNSEGTIIDCFDTGYLLGDYSSGRIKGYDNTRVFFMTKTPGTTNSTAYYSYAKKPVFSQQGGMQEDEFMLTITAGEGETIYYTLNGSIPAKDNESARIYAGPIKVNGDSVVRAVSFSSGKLPSLCTSATYIFERVHDIPVICLSTDPGGFFSTANGIYADGYGHNIGVYPFWSSNYYWNVERQVSFEYYNTDGSIGVAFDGGIQIAGAYSRALAQKSLVVRLRDEYGLSQVDFPFFDEGTTTFKHLLLRNSGQDYFMTKMRDAYILNCAQELGDVDTKRATPVALYINGEYWGMYNLRDKLNADYFSLKYGYDDDVVINYLTQYSSPKSGSNEDWMALKEFCYSKDFNIQENYDELGEWVDIDSFIDYWIVQMLFGNRDCHNIDFWKAEVEGAKWRPVLFDMDLALLPNDVNVVALHLGNGNLGYHDHVKDALISSDIFKKEFLERFSYVLTNIYTEEYLISNLEEYKSQIENEMEFQIERWGNPSSYEKWEKYVNAIKEEVILRRYEVPVEIKEFFELSEEEITELFSWYDPDYDK